MSERRQLTGEVSFGEPLGAAEVVQVRVHILIQQEPGLLLGRQSGVVQPAHQQTVIACRETETETRVLDGTDAP